MAAPVHRVAPELLVPVLSSHDLKAWPRNENGGRVEYMPLGDALGQDHRTDAHAAAYSVPHIARRLDNGAPAVLERGVEMVCAFFDIDGPDHGKDAVITDLWWTGELDKIERLRAAHRRLFSYRTRGGWRLVGKLPHPHVIQDASTADEWTTLYLRWVAYLNRRFGIVADRSCKDWQRLYRLPHATRDPRRGPERRQTIGDPRSVGQWTPELTAEDIEAAKFLARRKPSRKREKESRAAAINYSGPGLLHHLFDARGWAGAAIDCKRTVVRCPWESQHTSGAPMDGSTIIYAPAAGEVIGWMHCSHAHCRTRRLQEVLDFFEGHEIAAAREAAGIPVATVNAPAVAFSRPQIDSSADLSAVVDLAIKALSTRDIFQRGGILVDVVRDAAVAADGITRPEGTPRIRLLPMARLREEIDQAATFIARRKRNGDAAQIKVRPSREIVETLEGRGQWAYIRRLEGMIRWPVIRPDGSLLARPGYDLATRLLCSMDFDLEVSNAPTVDDARQAARYLLEVVAQFPFADKSSKSAYLAALLTVPARPAIDGPTPLLIIDANQRATGKTLLADTLGNIITGHDLPRRTAPDSPAEWRKAILGIAIAGDAYVLIDNVTGKLQSDALDAVLTGTEFRERLLGRNEELILPFRTVFIVTQNNGMLSSDLVRRALRARLETMIERPELRKGWTHNDLRGHCRKNRPKLLSAAMTILRAYQVAERPPVEMRPMGSYEAWSAVVRAPLIWLGLDDPAHTQEALRESADTEYEATCTLLREWHALYSERAVTVRKLLNDIAGNELSETRAALRDAIVAYCDAPSGGMPTARALGARLRSLRGRRSGAYIFDRAADRGEDGVSWRVRTVGLADSADSADCIFNRSRETTESAADSDGQEAEDTKQNQHSQHSQPGTMLAHIVGHDAGTRV